MATSRPLVDLEEVESSSYKEQKILECRYSDDFNTVQTARQFLLRLYLVKITFLNQNLYLIIVNNGSYYPIYFLVS